MKKSILSGRGCPVNWKKRRRENSILKGECYYCVHPVIAKNDTFSYPTALSELFLVTAYKSLTLLR